MIDTTEIRKQLRPHLEQIALAEVKLAKEVMKGNPLDVTINEDTGLIFIFSDTHNIIEGYLKTIDFHKSIIKVAINEHNNKITTA